jgi:hypothetical protein
MHIPDFYGEKHKREVWMRTRRVVGLVILVLAYIAMVWWRIK